MTEPNRSTNPQGSADSDNVLNLLQFLILAQIKREPQKAYSTHINNEMCMLTGRTGMGGGHIKSLRRLKERGYIREVGRDRLFDHAAVSPLIAKRRYYEVTEKGEELLDNIGGWLTRTGIWKGYRG